MKFFHLSDLHIGKQLHHYNLREDQEHILAEVLSYAASIHPDAIVIAGDIYDKSVPSGEAVSLFDEFLTALAKIEPAIPVLIISGNHDSAQRLDYASRLLGSHQIYIAGQAPEEEADRLKKITLTDEFGEIEVYLLPFVRPSIVRRALGQEEIESYQDAVFAAVNHMDIDTKKRNILVAHQFVTGAGRCDSEDIVVGGVDNIDASIFEAFDYTALGHIHSPQNIKENVRYCGTLLKYSVSEAGQEKSVTVIEMGKKNDIVIRTIPLIPKHDLRAIHGSYMEVTARTFYQGTATDDYVQITLTDEEDIPDGMQKLRTIYPNLLGLSYDNLRTRTQQTIDFDSKIKQKSEKQLFEELYEKQNNQPMSIEQKQFVEELFTRLQEDKS